MIYLMVSQIANIEQFTLTMTFSDEWTAGIEIGERGAALASTPEALAHIQVAEARAVALLSEQMAAHGVAPDAPRNDVHLTWTTRAPSDEDTFYTTHWELGDVIL